MSQYADFALRELRYNRSDYTQISRFYTAGADCRPY